MEFELLDHPADIGFRARAFTLEALFAACARALVSSFATPVENGYGEDRDAAFAEPRGAIDGALPNKVSARAKERGATQFGTLGSSNHFLGVRLAGPYNKRHRHPQFESAT